MTNKRLLRVCFLFCSLLLIATPAQAVLMRMYVTGEVAATDNIFEFIFDPAIPGSGATGLTSVVTTTPDGVDGIDFVPGTGETAVFAALPGVGAIRIYDIPSPPPLPFAFIPDTNLIAVPPAPGTAPSSVLATPTHLYYVENQFGFGGTTDHRIIRKPVGGGAEEVVFDGTAGAVTAFFGSGFINLEGLEIVDGGAGPELYFHAEDPGDATSRALVKIGLAAGVWDAATPTVLVGGLAEGGTDGSDELDFDPVTGNIYSTNIASGEVVAWDPFVGGGAGAEVIPGGFGSLTHFIDDIAVAGGAADGLMLLSASIDGIRSAGDGYLVFAGRGGVLGSINAGAIIANGGAEDGHVYALFGLDTDYVFDELTPVSPATFDIPEPSSLVLGSLLLVFFACMRRRRRA